jgi:uncharacterized membrane protein
MEKIMELSVRELLAENYLGIGAIGIGVIGAIVDDLIHGRIDDDFIQGISSSHDEVSQAFTDLIVSVIPHLYAMNTPRGWVQS